MAVSREVAERLRREAASAMFLAVDRRVAGADRGGGSDQAKRTPAAIAALKAAGLRHRHGDRRWPYHRRGRRATTRHRRGARRGPTSGQGRTS